MSNWLSTQDYVLPPGYKLQVIFDDEGRPSTVPLGTVNTRVIGILAGLSYREQIAKALRLLMVQTYGFDERDLRTLCYDVEGNECVVIKAMCKPKNNWSEQIQAKPDPLKLGTTDDIIDV